MAEISTDIRDILKKKAEEYLTPEDVTQQRLTEQEKIKQETAAALDAQQRQIKNEAAARGATVSGGKFQASGEAVMSARLSEAQRFSTLEQNLKQQQQAREGKGLDVLNTLAQFEFQENQAEIDRKWKSGERLSSEEFEMKKEQVIQDFQANQADLARKWQSGERLSGEEFTKVQNALGRAFTAEQNKLQKEWATLERQSSQEFQAQQENIDRTWKTGERTSDEAFKAAQTAQQQSWAKGEREAQQSWQAMEARYGRDFTAAQEAAKLAQQQGQFSEQLRWEQEAQRLQLNAQQELQQRQIDFQNKIEENKMAYEKMLNGYTDASGNYVPGIKAKEEALQRAWQSGETELARNLEITLQEMRFVAQEKQNDTSRWIAQKQFDSGAATRENEGSFSLGKMLNNIDFNINI